ncbi:uncharacterized protein I303_105704 [Kwoniella dejecticola CBS 10117]|uniref:Uncharacterized protein n=1 Tax=Kwoniella dejecticola CBS 10117 TaxID=1296121 RepID=A0A1A6A076_9TREE|nr:uncharacterized protein I303_05725 [Kwoniella dejecticola CBS 10117]OBR83446.1 hypothetical protein I303_05725 [Kwoniella dejecticola CBS 10117]
MSLAATCTCTLTPSVDQPYHDDPTNKPQYVYGCAICFTEPPESTSRSGLFNRSKTANDAQKSKQYREHVKQHIEGVKSIRNDWTTNRRFQSYTIPAEAEKEWERTLNAMNATAQSINASSKWSGYRVVGNWTHLVDEDDPQV